MLWYVCTKKNEEFIWKLKIWKWLYDIPNYSTITSYVLLICQAYLSLLNSKVLLKLWIYWKTGDTRMLHSQFLRAGPQYFNYGTVHFSRSHRVIRQRNLKEGQSSPPYSNTTIIQYKLVSTACFLPGHPNTMDIRKTIWCSTEAS